MELCNSVQRARARIQIHSSIEEITREIDTLALGGM